MSEANKRQVGGIHYRGGEYQHWDWVADNFGRGYFQGQITRYVSRWRLKNGKEDLQKALHYLDKLEELHRSGTLGCSGDTRITAANTQKLRGLSREEKRIFIIVAEYQSLAVLETVRPLILTLLEKSESEEKESKL